MSLLLKKDQEDFKSIRKHLYSSSLVCYAMLCIGKKSIIGKKLIIQKKKNTGVFLCAAIIPSVKIEDFKSIDRKPLFFFLYAPFEGF